MKLEEILPEIRKGRRFKRVNSHDWYSYSHIKSITLEDLFDVDDLELEPLPAPKMKAWINTDGLVRMVHDNDPHSESWTRAEWLDERP